MSIELPEFATAGTETEPSPALKASGWVSGDEPPAQVFNWLHRTTYDSVRGALAAGLTHTFTMRATHGSVLTTGVTDIVSNGVVVDSEGDIIISCVTDSAPLQIIATSTDGGLTFTERHTHANANATNIVIVPGVYALVIASGSVWYYASTPYTAWTTVSAATFTDADPAAGWAVTSLDGNPVLLIGSNFSNGYLNYCSSAAVPTGAGSWTEIDMTGSFLEINGIATNGTNNVIVGQDNGGTAARAAYAATSAGGLSGDWTNVAVGATARLRDVVYTGSYFVALDNAGVIWRSTTGASWTQGQTLSSTVDWLLADPELGMVMAFAEDEGVGGFWVSRDDGHTFGSVVTAGNETMFAPGSRYGYHTKLRRLYGHTTDVGTITDIKLVTSG